MTSSPLDFDACHRRALPDRLATPIGAAAAQDVRGIPPIAFRLPDGRAHRFVPGADTIRIEPGDDAPTVAELDEAAWHDFAGEVVTAAGLFYGGRVRFPRGAYAALERWEPALRALFSDRPIFDPSATEIGVDPRRSFGLDAPDEMLRAQLWTTGFLHVRGVFATDEIARLVEVVEVRQRAARPGDGTSWWAKRSDGAQVLCRLIYLGLVEPRVAALDDDARIRRLTALGGASLRPVVDRSDGHGVVIKNADVVEGLSDLPWHRDCGLGGHPIRCPALNIGIQLDAATAETGRLHFVPGSWRYSCHRSDLARATTVAVDTEPGDVTVHLGDVMHAAPPPTGAGPGRRVLYVTCMPERALEFIPAGKSYNDVIIARVGG
jgi:hypothetical protein